MTSRYLLAADVGGTKTAIAWGRIGQERLEILERRVYPSGAYPTLEALIDEFAAHLAQAGHDGAGAAACLAVAGPVDGEEASVTNLGWRIHVSSLRARYGWAALRLINDFEAVGHGLVHLGADELTSLQAGDRHAGGTKLAIGAGTGLGVAFLTHDGTRYRVHPTEAGHMDLAPGDALQDELLAWLRAELGHVSYERVLSGSGLTRVFRFLMEAGHGMPSSALQEAAESEEAASVISGLGLEGRDPLAARALDIFVEIYGACAGNLALATLPRGGVYIAGGIAPKIAGKLVEGGFMKAFLAKGRFEALLATLPVDIVMNPAVGLYGAFEVASRAAAAAAG